MRVPFLLSAFATATLAVAQAPTNLYEAQVYTAYANQRGGTEYSFELTGTQTIGRTATSVHAILYYRLVNDPRTNGDTMAQAELDIYRPTTTGEALAYRLVGDGNTLYRYDLAQREVSATTYGFYGDKLPQGKDPTTIPRVLLNQLRTATPGLASYLVRLADELNPTGSLANPRYANWLPGALVTNFDGVPPPMLTLTGLTPADTVTDPITNRVYVRGDATAQQYVFYGMSSMTTSRTVVFRLFDARPDPNNPLWEVQTVNVGMRTPGRVIDLTLTPNVTTTFPDGAFQPYTGAQGAAFRPVIAKG